MLYALFVAVAIATKEVPKDSSRQVRPFWPTRTPTRTVPTRTPIITTSDGTVRIVIYFFGSVFFFLLFVFIRLCLYKCSDETAQECQLVSRQKYRRVVIYTNPRSSTPPYQGNGEPVARQASEENPYLDAYERGEIGPDVPPPNPYPKYDNNSVTW